MASTRVLQQQGQQQRQFQQWHPQQQWRPQQQLHPQQQWRPQQQLHPQQLWRPQQPWGPGGLGSVGYSSGPTSWGARRGGRDVSSCKYRILTGPAVTTTIASLSFTLDFGASQCFIRDHTTVTPLSAPVSVALADPTSRPAVDRSSTTLPCSAVPSSFLTGLYILSFSRNLVSRASFCRSLPRLLHLALLALPAACAPLRTPPPFFRPLLPSRLSIWTYTTVFPLAKKFKVTSTLIRWLLATEGTRGSRVCCLHSNRGGEFRSGVLAGFYGEQGIRQSWTLPESPQKNGVAERRIGLVMDIARTSMIHARAPHFLWPYALCYAAHQLNLQPLVSRPEVSLTRLWIGSSGVGELSRLLLLPPALHQFLDSRDVRFDKSVSYYTWYPCRGLPVPPPPLFLAPSPPLAPAPPVPTPPLGLAPSGGVGAGGAATGGTRSGGARSRGAGAGGASAGGASPGGAGAGGTGTGGASSGGIGAGGASSGGAGARGGGAVGASTEEARARGTPTAPPHHYDTRLQTLRRLEREEQEQLEQERQELQRRCPLHALPSSPLADLRTVLFRSNPRRSLLVIVLPSPPESSLTVSSHPITDYYRAARPVVTRVLASLVTDSCASPSFVSALTAAVTNFASTRRLEYATCVVAAPPPRPLSVGGESALGCDVLEDRQFVLEFLAAASPSLCAMLLSPSGDFDALDILTPCTYREAVSGEWASQWKAAMDSELASWRSTTTYVDAVPPLRANVVDGMWLFKVKRPPGSPPVFKAHYVARGFNQREGVDFFRSFAPTPKMTTLRVLRHVAAQRDYELHSLDFSTAFLQGRPHEEIWLRRPPGFTDTFLPGTQWSLRRPVYGLRQSPCEWHDTLRSTLRDLGFRPSSANLSLFVRAGSTPLFILVYVDDLVFATADRAALAEVLWRFGFQFSTTQPTPLVVDHRLTGPFPDEPFESSGPHAELVGCLMYLMTCTRPDLAFPYGVLSRFVATGRHRHVHWTIAVRVAKYLVTTSGMGLVLGGTQPVDVEAEIYAGAMAAQELRWLTFLLTDLGERPHSAPTLYADNKAMILLCREPQLESRVKHFGVRYFLLRELQRRGQACLDFVASEANTTDVFTKALAPGDHHRFYVHLGLVEVGPRLL
ncbi:unnamed protein product [Closterium sp. NIES-53]